MKKTILALSMLVVLASCKKDKDEPAAITPTVANLTGNYKITASTMTGGGSTVDIFNNDMFYEPCMRDDIYRLNANMSYAITDAGTVCNPPGDYSGGTWALTSTSTIDMDGEEFTIKSWNGTTLVVEAGDPSSVMFSATYVKQ